MCRIAGIIDSLKNAEQIKNDVMSMCNAMKHGGPDDEGFYSDQDANLYFGHRRLALLDLSASGHQPMLNQEENLVIIFNGEIYNYLLLKAELQILGCAFHTESDTEVILLAYQKWGIASFAKLAGMFAFALFDKNVQITYLVRDQLAIKPMYYYADQNQLIFASEVKAFNRISYHFAENQDWKKYFLGFGHIPHPYTTLENVFSLSGGHYLAWNHQTSDYTINRFIKDLEIWNDENASDSVAEVASKLSTSVKSHLMADAPIGVFLSGGIDSSIITLVADQLIGENLKSLSLNFTDVRFSEEKFQHIVAKKINGKHASLLVQEKDFDLCFNQIISAMDQPTNDGINAWFINKFAKEAGLKAVLSGIGADELLGGYPSFKRIEWINRLKRLPTSILRLATYLPSDKLKRIYYLSYQNPIGEYLFLRGFYTPDAIAKILSTNQHEIDQLLEAFPIDKKVNDLQGAERISWFETNLFMQNQLLKDTDFMSMQHGIEVRVPFLDQNFINLLDQLPAEKRFPKRPKGLLIEAFRHILPEEIWNRPKMGFSFPLQQWFIKGGQITDEQLYSKYPHAQRLIRKFKMGKLHWSKAFALYQIVKNKP